MTVKELTKELNELRAEYQKKSEEVEQLRAKLDQPIPCKRCGRDAATAPLKIDEEIKKEYFRSILGQRPFSHTYRLYDNQLLITYETMKGDTLVNYGLSMKQTDADLLPLANLILIGSLVRVAVIDEAMQEKVLYEASAEDRAAAVKDVSASMNRLAACMDQMLIMTLRNTCTMFNALCAGLVEVGQDENFYKGAGLY
jgi:hypothetical protein|nr:MAG TPA: hypothetical protein [Herelleviridae sp.]